MASPPVLEFEPLLEPISAEAPAGAAIPYTMRQQLEDGRKEVSPEEYKDNDPNRPQEFKKADWPGIVKVCKEALTKHSKDLQLAGRMTEALTRIHGFAGLRDGLQLMSLLVEQCWDRLHPPVEEEGDLEIRAAPFNWLDDPDRGARFPNTVRLAPILPGGEISWQTWRLAAEKKGPLKLDDFDKAVAAVPREVCQDKADDINQCLELLDNLVAKLNELLGQYAPGFTTLHPALEECAALMKQILQKKGPAPSDEPAEESAEGGADEEGEASDEGAPARPRGRTREDLYQQLQDIAAQLQQIEPHSPIPYLISRACELGSMPFPMLMRALVRDENVLGELNRELGIKEEGA